jgi:hypothetical protein
VPFTAEEARALEFVDHIFNAKAKPVLEGLNKQFDTASLAPSTGDYTVTKAALDDLGIKEVRQINSIQIIAGHATTAAFVSDWTVDAAGTLTISGLNDSYGAATTNLTFRITADVILA